MVTATPSRLSSLSDMCSAAIGTTGSAVPCTNKTGGFAKFPCASAVWSMISASVAAWFASVESAPPTFVNPSSAAFASIAACVRLTP